MISLRQIKAARALLDMDQPALAEAAGVSRPTIQRLENPQFGPERSSMRVVSAVKAALEKEGVQFLATTETEGEGVRFRTP
ncbi:helix-turn-helix domain-containing protein [Limimaricola cinnabarinus]|uniref:helix-turn-helix domain-containing protein n=1 Tax=Limimaricola cinnabarinus TaxID=1125964 RepID=UPI002493C292|nr:helix-turn-helix domain-containing protein [Limimaricola cinnabarinus]